MSTTDQPFVIHTEDLSSNESTVQDKPPSQLSDEINDQSQSTISRVDIFEDRSSSAILRTRNINGQEQRPIVTSRGQRSLNHKSSVELLTCVHGWLNATEPTPKAATFIILRYGLYGLQNGARNNHKVYTDLAFANRLPDPKHLKPTTPNQTPVAAQTATHEAILAPDNQPFVRGYAPFETPVTEQPSTQVVDVSNSYALTGLKVDVSGVSVGIDGDLSHKTKEKKTKKYFQLNQSSVESTLDGSPGFNRVWLSLRENKHSESGTPPKFDVAVLIQRPVPQALFQARFILHIDTSWFVEKSNKMQQFFGVTKDDPILFNPGLPPVGLPSGVDPDQLGKLLAGKGIGAFAGYTNVPGGP